jgi:peptide/nickel transport system substrate-binding protein/oligopeptide transport system substrate-binding protein
MLYVCLWVCCYVLVQAPARTAEGQGERKPDSEAIKYGGIYRRVLADNPTLLDPAFVADTYSRAVVRQLFDGLIQFDVHLKPIPAIAEFWETSRDGLTWTFTLRRGVKFHHGREVTAQDFVYSFTRQLDPKRPGPLKDFFRHIQGADAFLEGKTASVQGLKAIDRYGLQILLKEPYVPSLIVLGIGNAAVVPREEVERLGERFAHAPVGTGPFKFVHWEPQKEIVLEANKDYYDGRPFLDRLVFKIVGKTEEEFGQFLKGDLEETDIPSDRMDKLSTDPQYQQYQFIRKPTLGLVFIGLNTRLKPFDDKHVRQAFNYAVDKETIVREITNAGSIPATGVLPPGMPGHDPDLRGYSYNPAKARELLAEAGYPGGTGLPVVQLWTVSKAETTQAELAAYQKYLAEVGAQVDIQVAPDWPSYEAMVRQQKLPMFRLSWYANIPDADIFFSPLLRSGSAGYYKFYDNPRVEQLLDQAVAELDEARRIALYREVERVVLDDAPWIMQHYYVSQRLYQPYVQGVEVSLLGDRAIPMRKVWLQKNPSKG